MGNAYDTYAPTSAGPQTTTDAYVDVGTAWDRRYIGGKTTIVVKNTGTSNGITYQILGSLDGGTNYDVVVSGPTNVAQSAQSVVNNADYYTHLKVQVKAQSAGSQSTVVVRAAGSA